MREGAGGRRRRRGCGSRVDLDRCGGEVDDHGGAAAGRVGGSETSPHDLDESAGDAQTESGAAGGTVISCPGEGIRVLVVKAGAGVGDGEDRAAVGGDGFDADRAGGGIAQCVVEKVGTTRSSSAPSAATVVSPTSM